MVYSKYSSLKGIKKVKKIIAVALIVLMSLTVLVACGAGGVAGDYKLKSMMGMDMEQLKSLYTSYGMDASEVEDLVTMTLNPDGSGKIVSSGNEQALTWKLSGSTLTLTSDGEDLACTLNGNEITITVDGVEAVMVKK